MKTICDKCDGTLFYVGFFKSARDLIIKNKIFFDRNIPTRYFFFACRCCDNEVEICDSNGIIEMTNNARVPHKRKYSIIEKLQKWS